MRAAASIEGNAYPRALPRWSIRPRPGKHDVVEPVPIDVSKERQRKCLTLDTSRKDLGRGKPHGGAGFHDHHW